MCGDGQHSHEEVKTDGGTPEETANQAETNPETETGNDQESVTV